MVCKKCGKITKEKYIDRPYCRECVAKLKEGYWNQKKEEEE